MMRRFFVLFLALLWLPIAILGGAQATLALLAQYGNWRYADLRTIDPSNGAAPPECDLIAAYARILPTDLEIRLDVLKSAQPWKCDFYLAIRLGHTLSDQTASSSPTSFQWDYLLIAPFGRPPHLLQSPGNLVTSITPRVLRNPSMDTWIVRFSRLHFPDVYPQALFYAWSTLPGQSAPSDTIGPFALLADPPPPAPLALLFWNTLPSATPAQTLRRWDGAHTGPYGQRHGLRHLLEAAARHNIPLILADLRHPAALAGLDAVGGLDEVTNLATRRLISLPEFAQGSSQLSKAGENLSHEAGRTFKVPATSLVFGALPYHALVPGKSYFARLPDPYHILSFRGARLIPLPAHFPLPAPSSSGVTRQDGLSLSLRQRLLAVATSPDPSDFILLGDSLPQSPWGDIGLAQSLMQYLAEHPWIRVLDENALADLPDKPITSTALPRCSDVWCSQESPFAPSGGQNVLEQTLENTLPGLLSQPATPQSAALQKTLALASVQRTHPTADPALAALQANYLGELGYLIQALEWARQPSGLNECAQDLDGDGLPECILASTNSLAIIHLRGGRLVHYSRYTREGGVQIIASTEQLAFGLSDPSLWDFAAGPWADPAVFPGAFDDGASSSRYQVKALEAQCLILEKPDHSLSKRYCLNASGIEVWIQTSQPFTTRLPITLAPQTRFHPGAGYRYYLIHQAEQLTWGITGFAALRIKILEGRLVTFSHFGESRAWLTSPEDPNRDYPAGHYLPFPLLVLELEGNPNLRLQLDFP